MHKLRLKENMKTIISWFIANFETAMVVLLIAVFAPLYLSTVDDISVRELGVSGVTLAIIFFGVFIALPAVFSTRSFSTSVTEFLVLVVFYIFLLVYRFDFFDGIFNAFNNIRPCRHTRNPYNKNFSDSAVKNYLRHNP